MINPMTSHFPDQARSFNRSSDVQRGPHADLVGLGLADVVRMMEEGTRTSVQLVQAYIDRIAALDANGPRLGSVLETNPDALAIAAERDAERARGRLRSPLHGVPVLVKDSLDTADAMHTTAGSLALMNSTPKRDATVVALLRDAGAVILGKASLTEWSNMRGSHSSSGWNARNGSTKNPHSLPRSPSGSSSGSAVAVAADFAPVTIGTETDGSIICPASACGVVGFKPTVGLTSRAGVIPISTTQDSVGVFGKYVTDVAATLSVISGVDERDSATGAGAHMAGTDFRAALHPNALQGVRLGVPANFGFTGYSPKADAVFKASCDVLTSLGAEIVTGIEVPTADALEERPGEFQRMLYEYRHALNAYLAERGDPEVRSMADLVAFNNEHADQELRYFGQEALVMAEATHDADDSEMHALHERLQRLSRDEGIDAMLRDHNLHALIAPTMAPASVMDLANGEKFSGAASSLAAIAGYPVVTVPAGFALGLPVGISFIGTAWSDARLLSLAYAWEQATRMYRTPTYRKDDIAADPATPQFEFPVAHQPGVHARN